MEGYESHTYGGAFADVYDDWYQGVSDVEDTVATLSRLAGSGPVLELGVGTGRLAIPLAATGVHVVGIDSSQAMLARLRARQPTNSVRVIHGDMVADLPPGPFTLAFVAYNTLFNLTEPGQQAACFSAVADRLDPGGRFVVEAFVPADPPHEGDEISVRTITADRVVLSVSRHDPDNRAAAGQFVDITEAGGVRLRPWSIRYSNPAELDSMAAGVGMTVESRCVDASGAAFDPASSDRHFTVYRLDR